MPPKKKPAVAQAAADVKVNSSSLLMPDVSSFEEILNKRLNEHAKELNAIIVKSKEVLHNDIKAIQASQQFMSDKFDQILAEMTQIKAENVQLKQEVNELNAKVSKLEEEQENINSYSRRDCLEFHGIPQNSTENTDELVKRVANLVGVEINPYDISISHRLPSRRGSTPPIIAKFTKRRTKEIIYQSKRKLKSRNSSDIGCVNTENKLYINESLSPRAKELYFNVREFRRAHNFKYAWTMNGKSFLKEDDEARSTSFSSINEFDRFKSNYL